MQLGNKMSAAKMMVVSHACVALVFVEGQKKLPTPIPIFCATVCLIASIASGKALLIFD